MHGHESNSSSTAAFPRNLQFETVNYLARRMVIINEYTTSNRIICCLHWKLDGIERMIERAPHEPPYREIFRFGNALLHERCYAISWPTSYALLALEWTKQRDIVRAFTWNDSFPDRFSILAGALDSCQFRFEICTTTLFTDE